MKRIAIKTARLAATDVLCRRRVLEGLHGCAFCLLFLLWWQGALVGEWFTVKKVLWMVVQLEWPT